MIIKWTVETLVDWFTNKRLYQSSIGNSRIKDFSRFRLYQSKIVNSRIRRESMTGPSNTISDARSTKICNQLSREEQLINNNELW